MNKKKINFTNIILIACLLVGLGLLLYPTVSEVWNSYRQTHAISSYTEDVAKVDEDKYKELWEAASAYNSALLKRKNPFFLSKSQKAEYSSLLDVSGVGIMGYIDIPSIKCELPIYHGTDDSVLQIGVGHLDWTSLPVGGESTHCVLSGHRGLPSATLFTHLDRLVGDTFVLHILDTELTYEVDQILIVEPEDIDSLRVVKGEDLCTLVTCTPYGKNTHRLLVRGHRIENKHTVRVTSDAILIEPLIVAPIVSLPLLLIMLIPLFFKRKNRSKTLSVKGDVNEAK